MFQVLGNYVGDGAIGRTQNTHSVCSSNVKDTLKLLNLIADLNTTKYLNFPFNFCIYMCIFTIPGMDQTGQYHWHRNNLWHELHPLIVSIATRSLCNQTSLYLHWHAVLTVNICTHEIGTNGTL